jgi:hypothetical protein
MSNANQSNSAIDPAAKDATQSRVDEAALLGTSLAAILALTLGEGGWDWLGTTIGAALLAVIYAFFALPGLDDKRRWIELVALSLVTALCAALVIAWPWQWIWSKTTGAGETCAAIGRAHGAWWVGKGDLGVGLARLNEKRKLHELSKDDQALVLTGTDDREWQENNCLGQESFKTLWIPAISVFVGTLAVTAQLSSRKSSRQPDPS